ncbi:DUF2780 domain-containing protein [Candidatus Methylospira mobilis]|uniref:DUF2780 domain-containing protein n=1 Tax=Candidatus Methylospira mobilis TaxID=1808979 RepID=A0A5Q0BN80_9GAMM|nr:DUF2780 domain-containing protein [Candidatus Methylospira mobilis]QFY43691.1 DUF2780 domain-containing protein [Candidatus Methylospira mobilis]WNV04681.1 DUF2780 domain-containing protein [Candidatus Methylospira mobilis]
MKPHKTSTRLSSLAIIALCFTPWFVAAAGQTSAQTLPSSVTNTAAQISNAANQVAGGAAAANSALSNLALASTLARQLNITPQQALGGAGSIFSIAKQQLNPTDFSQLSKAVPDINQYLTAAAPLLSSSSNTTALLGSAAGLLGGQGSSLSELATLAGSFQKLGLSPDLIQQFVPIMLQYVQSQGGSTAASLLKNALL